MANISTDSMLNDNAAVVRAGYDNSLKTSQDMEKMQEESAEQLLFRTAQGNAMAKVKGLAKIIDTANQG